MELRMLMRRVAVGAVAIVGVVAVTAPPLRAAPAADASALLESARKMRETWSKDFPGFTARVAYSDGGKSATGSVKVGPTGAVALDLPDADLQKEAAGAIRMMVSHRMPEAASYKPTLAPADSDPQGQAILLNDGLESMYRIRDGQILQVNRTMGGMRFTIDVLRNTIVEGGRYLPASYAVAYRNPKTGALVGSEMYDERYTRVGGFYLPAEQRKVTMDPDRTTVSVLRLSELRLAARSASARRSQLPSSVGRVARKLR